MRFLVIVTADSLRYALATGQFAVQTDAASDEDAMAAARDFVVRLLSQTDTRPSEYPGFSISVVAQPELTSNTPSVEAVLSGVAEPEAVRPKVAADPDEMAIQSLLAKFDAPGQAPPGSAMGLLALVRAAEADINNGGFDQFFKNSSGARANELVAALETIGARRMASIVSEAQIVALHHLHSQPGEPVHALEALDAQFCAYPENLTRYLLAYVRRFGLLGDNS